MEMTLLATTSSGIILASVAAFLATVLAICGLWLLRSPAADDMQARLTRIGAKPSARSNKILPGDEKGFLIRWAQPVGKLILPEEGWQKTTLTKKLVQAGFRTPQALPVFLGSKVLLAFTLPMSFAGLLLLAAKSVLILQVPGLLLLGTTSFLGFLLPDLILGHITRQRQRAFIEGFPDALDLLVICVEAGLGLDAAIDRVARELRVSNKAIAAELALTNLEVRAGTTRAESLRALAERINVDQVHALVTLLVQAERFGTSVGGALRGFAEEMRVERVQRARETAAKLPTRLIFPVILCIFPALFLIILGPAVITIMGGFSSM